MTSADVRIGRRSLAALPAMALALACALSALSAGSAIAQDTLYIGKDDPSVTVDMSVIDALGPPPRMPELMLPITSQGQAIPIRPAASAAAAAAAQSPVTLRSPTAAKPKPATQAAAKPAPAPAAAPKPAQAAPKPAPAAPAASAKPAPPPAAAAEPAPAPKPAPAPAAKPAPAAPTPEAVASAPPKPAAKTTSPAPPPPPAATAPPPPPQAAPKPAPAPAPAAKPQVASAPAAPAAAPSAGTIQLLFGSGEADLNEDAKKTLSGVAQTLKADDNARLQLMAFAAGAENEASMARRLSLSRALAVRSYLIAEGVRSTRIDVRALGNKTEAEPADRVDLLIDRR